MKLDPTRWPTILQRLQLVSFREISVVLQPGVSAQTKSANVFRGVLVVTLGNMPTGRQYEVCPSPCVPGKDTAPKVKNLPRSMVWCCITSPPPTILDTLPQDRMIALDDLELMGNGSGEAIVVGIGRSAQVMRSVITAHKIGRNAAKDKDYERDDAEDAHTAESRRGPPRRLRPRHAFVAPRSRV